jgi:hypothetical protein
MGNVIVKVASGHPVPWMTRNSPKNASMCQEFFRSPLKVKSPTRSISSPIIRKAQFVIVVVFFFFIKSTNSFFWFIIFRIVSKTNNILKNLFV